MTKFLVKKDYIIHLKQLCSVEKTRFYLMGILFERDSGCMVATDGHRLGMYKNAFPAGAIKEDLIIDFSKSFISQLKKLSKKIDYIEIEITDNFDVKYEGETCGMVIDGTFPNWRRVCPQLNNAKTVKIDEIGFNMQYLESFGRFPQVTFYESNGGAQVILGIKLWQNPDFMGVLMPMRI